tara:strand:- start:340 stop:645 length:306 start_codon:yes stop_codon:yes gene_type:complete
MEWKPEIIPDNVSQLSDSLQNVNMDIHKEDSFTIFKKNLKIYNQERVFKLLLNDIPPGMVDNIDYKTLNELLRKDKKNKSMKRSRRKRKKKKRRKRRRNRG